MKCEIVTTGDGSKTIFLPEMDEQYHSLNGAITESDYVYTGKGYCFNKSDKPVIFEIGFGTGLNALLTAIKANENHRQTTYFTIEKFPLPQKTTKELDYGRLISPEAQKLYETIHLAEWETPVNISNYFSIIKIKDDLNTFDFLRVPPVDIVYFDAFGPDKQPEMWNENIFRNIYDACAINSVFVTYSAKGEIRRSLARCGYDMERLPGPPGKRQMLRGIKK